MSDTPSRKGTGRSRQTYTADGVTITYALVDSVVGLAAKVVNGVVSLSDDAERVDGEVYTVEPDGAVGVITIGEVGLPSGTGVVAADWDGVNKLVGAQDGSGNPGCVRPATATVDAEMEQARDITVEDRSDATDVRVTLR